MGDGADLMLEGILCEQCGSLIGLHPVGHPRNCGCDPRMYRLYSKLPNQKQEGPYKCPCGESFWNNPDFVAHRKEAHPKFSGRQLQKMQARGQVLKRAKTVPCPHCNRKFHTEDGVLSHIKAKHTEEP